MFEFWDAGTRDVYLYTEDRDFAKELRKQLGRCAFYERKRKVFAWQLKVPGRLVPLLERMHQELEEARRKESEKILVENQ